MTASAAALERRPREPVVWGAKGSRLASCAGLRSAVGCGRRAMGACSPRRLIAGDARIRPSSRKGEDRWSKQPPLCWRDTAGFQRLELRGVLVAGSGVGGVFAKAIAFE